MKSPLSLEPLFAIGPVQITEPVVTAWAVIALLAGASIAGDAAPEPSSRPGPRRRSN